MEDKNKSLSDMQRYVMHLKQRLWQYQIDGVEPPSSFLVELRMAQHLLKLESIDTIRVDKKI